MDLLATGLPWDEVASHHDVEVLDRRVLLSDLGLCGAALDREAKDRRVLHSVVPRTLRGITITNPKPLKELPAVFPEFFLPVPRLS